MSWSEKAEADLDEIWNFTRRRWSREQADLYLERLNGAITDEVGGKRRARPIDHVAPGLLRLREVRHFLYFRNVPDGILVARVLHDSMDETLHLP